MKVWPQTEGQGWKKRLRGIYERQSSERGGVGELVVVVYELCHSYLCHAF